MNEAISQMLVTFRTFETEVLPNNFKPLSISVKSSWKKRKILDLIGLLGFVTLGFLGSCLRILRLPPIIKKRVISCFHLTLRIVIIMCLSSHPTRDI